MATQRADLLPRTRCTRCCQPAVDMRINCETDANALDGAAVPPGSGDLQR
ncbi:hypothetical protein RISW2_14675 [Roseivivax isoporae LMG 25204]|uniref:Uncharacterized protein n=1 Tax=Roseivivax isoporae LMG 25204 TaxID=1449351 RepID=X7F5I0_9RHOB|nr:hypothetical protein RISW2_14675 [Roseivivax isoporae LMG 25204]